MVTLEDVSRCIDSLRYIPPECVDKCSEENFESNKDWCLINCEVRSDDVNNPMDCVRVLRDVVLDLARSVGLDPQFVYELDPIISRFRTVRSGDIILPDDINNINDAIRKVRDILEQIEQAVSLYPMPGFEVGLGYAYLIGYDITLSLVREDVPVATVTSRPPECREAVHSYVKGDIDPYRYVSLNEFGFSIDQKSVFEALFYG